MYMTFIYLLYYFSILISFSIQFQFNSTFESLDDDIALPVESAYEM